MNAVRNVEGGGRKQPRKIGITAKPNKTISIVRLHGLRLTYKQVRHGGGAPIVLAFSFCLRRSLDLAPLLSLQVNPSKSVRHRDLTSPRPLLPRRRMTLL